MEHDKLCSWAGGKKKQSTQNKFKDDNGNVFTYSEDISNQFNDFLVNIGPFNDFFVNIGPKLASNIYSSSKNYFDHLEDPKNCNMYMKPIVEMDITKIIEKFNQNKSAGNDDISNYIIKRGAKARDRETSHIDI